MATDPVKTIQYTQLVQQRKQCQRCPGLTNPADPGYAVYDTDQLGPWSRWQGNLAAPILIVGQDWGDTRSYSVQEGRERDNNPTNMTLIQLLETAGIIINKPSMMDGPRGAVFLTNAVLCLKTGGLQGSVQPAWFRTCGEHFLKHTIDLIQPRVLVSLGQWAYRTISLLYALPCPRRFKDAVNQSAGFRLSDQTRFFPMYHCGQRILNTHRSFAQQQTDWLRIRTALGTFLEHTAEI